MFLYQIPIDHQELMWSCHETFFDKINNFRGKMGKVKNIWLLRRYISESVIEKEQSLLPKFSYDFNIRLPLKSSIFKAFFCYCLLPIT